MLPGESSIPVLVVVARSQVCALRMSDIIETMRPLPVEPMAGVPAMLLGMAVVRGAPAPVVDLGALVGAGAAVPASRWVMARTGTRAVALAVDSVLGPHALDPRALEALPPLVQAASGGAAESLVALDDRLLTLLRAGRLVPDELWRRIEARESAGGP